MRVLLALVLLFQLASPAFAAMSLIEKWRNASLLNAQEWRSLVSGKTLTYSIDAYDLYREQYDRYSNNVTAQFNNGECIYGRWEAQNDYFCYYWKGSETVCSRHARFGKELLINFVEDGQNTDEFQLITDISDTPLSCGASIMS
ncbi:MAG TPA: hypothetical protein VLA51_11485 [Paracoccaceae bacterium]|nr:hypothetical protein [Paracoccaceae bacterium]